MKKHTSELKETGTTTLMERHERFERLHRDQILLGIQHLVDKCVYYNTRGEHSLLFAPKRDVLWSRMYGRTDLDYWQTVCACVRTSNHIAPSHHLRSADARLEDNEVLVEVEWN